MSTTSEGSPSGAASSDLSQPLRSQLTAHLLSGLSTAAAASSALKVAPAVDINVSRRAALYALDNFQRLQDPACNCITEEGLYALLRFGSDGADARPLLSHLYRQLKSIGHVIGETKSTMHVSANGYAMPIHFTSPRYGIDALDLFKLLCATAQPVAK